MEWSHTKTLHTLVSTPEDGMWLPKRRIIFSKRHEHVYVKTWSKCCAVHVDIDIDIVVAVLVTGIACS